MPGKLRRLSGGQVVMILSRFGFSIFTQQGSHAKLRRRGTNGEKQTIVVPMHDTLDLGTLRAIIRQTTRFIPLEELHRFFYTG
jgi:predicted RNA binding protein YcfA (HicA-like mRNA interferase family)